MRKLAFLILFGLGGGAILVGLGVWQLQRLAWKEAILAEIDARIAAAPVALPERPDPLADAYLPVEVSGVLTDAHLKVLVSRKGAGPGYRIIRPMILGDDSILIDLGFVSTEDAPALRFEAGPPVRVVGNLQWPQEVDGFTPAPDLERNIWFARDVPAMAAALGTLPVLVVRRDPPDAAGPLMPMPVDTAAIPNDHLQYAVTWFSLAAIWTAMSIYFLRRAPARNKS